MVSQLEKQPKASYSQIRTKHWVTGQPRGLFVVLEKSCVAPFSTAMDEPLGIMNCLLGLGLG